MKIAYERINSVIEIKTGEPFAVVVENQDLFRNFIEDISNQCSGDDGEIILSSDNVPIPICKHIDVIKDFAPFNINTKQLISKLSSIAEKTAIDEAHFAKTSVLMSEIERYIYDIFFDIPFNIECHKLSFPSLLKTASISVLNDFESPLEAVLDYMSFISCCNKDKLFVTVNISNYFNKKDIERFANSISDKQINLLMVESNDKFLPECIKRVIIDADFCEI